MATTVRSTTRDTNVGSSTPSSTPASQTTGDVLVIVLHANSNPITIVQETTQAGTNPLTVDLTSTGQVSHSVAVFSRRIVGGDPTTWNFTIGSSQRWTAIATLYQSPNTSTIYDVAPSLSLQGTQDGSTTGVNAPDITTLTANALHAAVIQIDSANASLQTSPSGYTLSSPTGALPQGMGDQCAAWANKVIASPGAIGAQNFTWNSLVACSGISFAIKDVAASSVVTPVAMHQYRQRRI